MSKRTSGYVVSAAVFSDEQVERLRGFGYIVDGVVYHEELAGCTGSVFTLMRNDDTTEAMIVNACDKLYRDKTVAGRVKVADRRGAEAKRIHGRFTRKGEGLGEMIKLAVEKHDGVYDKGGVPYVLHTLTVMHYLKAPEDEELQEIAIGHDLIEDTDVVEEDLRQRGFSDRVVQGILALTRWPGMSEEDYRRQVKANRDAVRVKRQDLRHNSDIRRLKGLTPKDIERVARYHAFYIELEEEMKSWQAEAS